jgi:8-oxo-dGTP diphosphatase
VTVYLIRHAVAKDRSRWDDDDSLRPLTTRGGRQADGLVEALGGHSVSRVLSSPAVRCIDTVFPLADERGFDVEVEKALFEGNGQSAVELVRQFLADGEDVALCSHGDVIPEVVEALGYRCDRCAKGSTWIIDPKRATYLPPPD